jgi:hypothetical protein
VPSVHKEINVKELLSKHKRAEIVALTNDIMARNENRAQAVWRLFELAKAQVSFSAEEVNTFVRRFDAVKARVSAYIAFVAHDTANSQALVMSTAQESLPFVDAFNQVLTVSLVVSCVWLLVQCQPKNSTTHDLYPQSCVQTRTSRVNWSDCRIPASP